MARGGFSTSNHFNSASPLTAYPITMAAWVYCTSVSAENYICMMSEMPTGDWLLLSTTTGAKAQAQTNDFAVTTGTATTTASLSANTWHHICGVFPSTDSRSIYLDGGNKITNNTNVASANLSGFDEIHIGSIRTAVGSSTLRVAEVGIWNVALSDAEVASLGKGFACHLIRPASLVHYLPAVRNTIALRGDIVEVGAIPVAASHPPIIGAIAA